jgi:hypothetical protein
MSIKVKESITHAATAASRLGAEQIHALRMQLLASVVGGLASTDKLPSGPRGAKLALNKVDNMLELVLSGYTGVNDEARPKTP